MITTGALAKTLTARIPSAAVKAYAGATDEIPSIVPPTGPTTLLFRPLSAISSTPFRVGVVSYDERSALESVILHDVLDPGVVLQAVDGEIFAITGMLETAVWHLGLQRDMTVDPDAAEVQPG
jgi:hypothetical protein